MKTVVFTVHAPRAWSVEVIISLLLNFISDGLNWPLQKLQEDWALTFSGLISGIVWVTSLSYNWSMVSKVTVNQL